MNEAVEQPIGTEPSGEPETQEAPLSVMEHAAQFSPEAQQAQANETPEEKAEREHHSAEQRRDKANGQFREGKQRHRAKSQQAGPEDAPRIQQLTARAKAAEEKLTAAETELARLRTQHASPAQIAKAEAKVEQAQTSTFSEPEPTEDDPKFAGDYGKFLRAAAAWEGRKAYADAQTAERQQRERTSQETAQRETLKSWAGRVDAAKTKYSDFEAVAYAPTIIPPGSVIDAWIMEHKAGADVLYYLQSPTHRQELESLLMKPVLEQAEDLSLLSQRLLSPPSTAAGQTGSAPGRVVVLPPKPPNPVRTEAQRASDTPPPMDGSLSVAEHRKHFGPKPRR